jgi:hypothetical protein
MNRQNRHLAQYGDLTPSDVLSDEQMIEWGLCPRHGVALILVTSLVSPGWECPRCLEPADPEDEG